MPHNSQIDGDTPIPIKYSIYYKWSRSFFSHLYRVTTNVKTHLRFVYITLFTFFCFIYILLFSKLLINANWFRIKAINNCYWCQDDFQCELYPYKLEIKSKVVLISLSFVCCVWVHFVIFSSSLFIFVKCHLQLQL